MADGTTLADVRPSFTREQAQAAVAKRWELAEKRRANQLRSRLETLLDASPESSNPSTIDGLLSREALLRLAGVLDDLEGMDDAKPADKVAVARLWGQIAGVLKPEAPSHADDPEDRIAALYQEAGIEPASRAKRKR